MLSTLLGVGTELSLGGEESDLVRALQESTQQNANRAGQRITERNLNIQPTITVRPGWPLRVIVHKDLVLRPYRDERSRPMTELKLGKLPDRTPVKITITVSPDLNQALREYAAIYRATYGEAKSVADLIPFMLGAFLESDRGFVKARKAVSLDAPVEAARHRRARRSPELPSTMSLEE